MLQSDAISACEKSENQWQAALELLAEMREWGIQPDVITYNAAISACEKSKDQWQPALELLAEMRKQGIQPDVTTCTNPALSSACEMFDVHHQEASHAGSNEPSDCNHPGKLNRCLSTSFPDGAQHSRSKQGRNKIRF